MDCGGERMDERRVALRGVGGAGVECPTSLGTTYTHERSCFRLVHRLHTGRVWSQATLRLRHGLQTSLRARYMSKVGGGILTSQAGDRPFRRRNEVLSMGDCQQRKATVCSLSLSALLVFVERPIRWEREPQVEGGDEDVTSRVFRPSELGSRSRLRSHGGFRGPPRALIPHYSVTPNF